MLPACGCRVEAGRRFVRMKSLDKLKDSIRAKTRRTRGVSLERVIAALDPVLRGWFGTFKQLTPPHSVISTGSSEGDCARCC